MTNDQPHPDDERRLWAQYAAANPAAPAACPPAIELAAWLDGRATDPQRDAIEAHLAGCAECIDAVGGIRLAREAVAGSLAGAPDRVKEAARMLVGASPGPRERRMQLAGWQTIGRWSMAAAASVAICVVGYRAGESRLAFDAAGADKVMVGELSFGLLGELSEVGLVVALEGDLR
jgi:anti-sigma factor RsiW